MSEAVLDRYDEVHNGAGTYAAIAENLEAGGCVVVGWTDNEGSHYDLLFALRPRQFGQLRGGLHGSTDLFVAICGRGCFGFSIDPGRTSRRPDYVAQKLSIEPGVTADALTALLNGVMAALTRVTFS